MAAICYSDPIPTVPTNEQLLGEKRTWGRFQSDIPKIEGLVRIYHIQTDGWTGRQTDSARHVDQLYIHIVYV